MVLLRLRNSARDYAWGSTTLIAELQGRTPSGNPEAEVWFGDHPANPAITDDGRTLDTWLAEEAAQMGRLPYLLKLLAAGSPLSIQAHPSKAQAELGFAREESAGIPRDAPGRTYRDRNHKPELLVAISDEFHALAGLRSLVDTRRLVSILGPGAKPLRDRIDKSPISINERGRRISLAEIVGWLLSPQAAADVTKIIDAAVAARSDEFSEELRLVRSLADMYPADPGVVIAMLMNQVTLQRGEGLFIPAGTLHAYIGGLGVEIMASSDNVLRGGLTPKYIDARELVAILDPVPNSITLIRPTAVAEGVVEYPVPIDDFRLRRVTIAHPRERLVTIDGPSVVLVVEGSIVVAEDGRHEPIRMSAGDAALVTDERENLVIAGCGEAFIAGPGLASVGALRGPGVR